MSVLIRRSDAIAIIQNAKYKFPTWPHIAEAKEDMVQAIKSAPTIDAVPVVRGEWLNGVDYYEPPMVNPYFMVTHLICSKCGHSHGNPEKKPNFCPNCGAKMESEGST
jgi:rubrerythrin